MFDDLKKVWNTYGKNEPYWSVLTNNKYFSLSIKNNYDNFFETGKNTIKTFENILQKYNYTLKDKIILDFGCGVGRLTKACLNYSSNVYGMDISEEHLKIANKNVKSAKFYKVINENTLPQLNNKPEVIISLITLQHNSPKLIKKFLINLLKLLQDNGIALIQIPYKIDSKLINSIDKMQMHALPINDVKKITKGCNCIILDEIESDVGGKDILSKLYVIKK